MCFFTLIVCYMFIPVILSRFFKYILSSSSGGVHGQEREQCVLEECFISDTVENCWLMIIIKSRSTSVGFAIVFQFSACNCPLSSAPWANNPTVPPVCH